jgi:hypothetical protein
MEEVAHDRMVESMWRPKIGSAAISFVFLATLVLGTKCTRAPHAPRFPQSSSDGPPTSSYLNPDSLQTSGIARGSDGQTGGQSEPAIWVTTERKNLYGYGHISWPDTNASKMVDVQLLQVQGLYFEALVGSVAVEIMISDAIGQLDDEQLLRLGLTEDQTKVLKRLFPPVFDPPGNWDADAEPELIVTIDGGPGGTFYRLFRDMMRPPTFTPPGDTLLYSPTDLRVERLVKVEHAYMWFFEVRLNGSRFFDQVNFGIDPPTRTVHQIPLETLAAMGATPGDIDTERHWRESPELIARRQRKADRQLRLEAESRRRHEREEARRDLLRRAIISTHGEGVMSRLKGNETWIGMTTNMAEYAFGKPTEINRTVTSSSTHEQWVYPARYLYFDDGVLTAWQD